MDASPETPVYYTPILLKLARSIKTSETSPFSGGVASGGITGRNLDSGQTDALPARRKSLPPIDEHSLFEIDAERTIGAQKVMRIRNNARCAKRNRSVSRLSGHLREELSRWLLGCGDGQQGELVLRAGIPRENFIFRTNEIKKYINCVPPPALKRLVASASYSRYSETVQSNHRVGLSVVSEQGPSNPAIKTGIHPPRSGRTLGASKLGMG
jgi:hypothetical protein